MEVPWLNLPENWQRIRPHLERLCERQELHGMTVESLARDIASGSLRCWILGDFQAVFLTKLYQQAAGKIMCALSWAAGEDVTDKQREVLGRIEEYARDNGARGLEIMGRRGWERVVRDWGYRNFYVGLIKEF